MAVSRQSGSTEVLEDGNESHEHDHAHAGLEHAHSVKDPVCAMDVDPQTAKHHTSYQSHDYYFCSQGCEKKFSTEPLR